MFIKLPVLEALITTYLPEAKIDKKSNENELTNITGYISAILNAAKLKVNEELVFTAFSNSEYPISVVEPTDVKKPKPYIDTCSHAIYIGIDGAALRKLHALVPSINDIERLPETQKQYALSILSFLSSKQ